jgi:tRNA A37 threonylcarbamoyltransferase TsaD
MKAIKYPLLWLLLAGAAAPLAGCNDGPFEEAGEEIDDAVDDVGDAIDRRN